jgi:hypothetical protein
LADLNDSIQEEGTKESRKILIMGNSHIRNIKTRYFINECLVNKIMVFSFNQAIEKISSLDNDYDCVFVQVFTNHLRESSPKECAQLCTKFSVELSQQCEFAKIVISLPFPTFNDYSLNEKIDKFNILMQYKFLSHPTVSLLDNSGLSFRGRPIYNFFAKDSLHLSVQGTNIYASSMKSCIRRCLNIEEIQQANHGRQSLNFDPPNSDSMYNERNSKGFDRTYQALSREGPGFGTGNNQFNHPHHPPFIYPFFPGFNPGMVRF